MAIDALLEMIVNEFCLPLPYTIHPAAIIHKPLFIGSFFIGFFLGIIFALPFVIIYSKNWIVKRKYLRRRYDIESFFMRLRTSSSKKWSFFLPSKTVTTQSFHQKNITKIEKKEVNIKEKTEIYNSGRKRRGMVDVLMQKNSDAVLEEVTKQNIEVMEQIEENQDTEREKMRMKVLQQLLREESDNGTLPNDFSIEVFVKNIEKDSEEIREMTKTENMDQSVNIEREKQFQNDYLGINLVFDKQRCMNNRLKREMKKKEIRLLRNKFRQSDIDTQVAERIQNKLELFDATWNKNCSLEQKRLTENLDKKQWDRRMVAENKILTQKEEASSLEESPSLLNNVLNHFVSNGHLTNKRCKELINEFKQDMVRRRKQIDKEASRQIEELSRKLKERRVQELNNLEVKHLEKKRKLIEANERNKNENSDVESSVQNYFSETTKMNKELENKLTELDQSEAEAIELILKQENQSRAAEIQQAELEFINELEAKTNFSQNEVQKIIHQYKSVQMKHAEMCAKTHKEQELLFKEQLKKQREERNERKKMAEAEQAAILKEQQNIVTKMLEENVNMDEEKKEEILMNHKEKMKELCNHMETNRIKQEQNFQVLLAQRRAKVQELREKKEKAAKEKKEEENKKLQEKLTAEIEAAELKLEQEKSEAEEKLRQQHLEETRQILEQQHNELATEIGKLEVEKARRKALMRRQDKTVQCIQEKLEGLVDSERTPQDLSNQIFQHHQNKLQHLEMQQKAEKEKQQRILQATIDEKHRQKQQELAKEFDENKQKESHNQRQKGVSKAASVLSNALTERRHEESIAALKKEMDAELERKRRELDASFENNLSKELSQQNQKFLLELAAISDLDKDEIKDLVSEAVEETGASKKTKKKLTQNLTKELEKAKTELGVTDDER